MPGTQNKDWCHRTRSLQANLFQRALAWSSLMRTASCSKSTLTGWYLFSPKIPNFDSTTPKFVPKVCLYVYALKKVIKIITNLKANTNPTQIINSLHFHNNSQKQLCSLYNSKIMNTHDMNQQQQPLMAATTLLNHDFINNYNHNTISYQFEQNQQSFK